MKITKLEAGSAPLRMKLTVQDGAERKLTAYTGSMPAYEGPYEVTPDIRPQTLPSKSRCMAEDVRVNAIPKYEVSNAYGTTIIIGG